jgi:hypothetical protein
MSTLSSGGEVGKRPKPSEGRFEKEGGVIESGVAFSADKHVHGVFRRENTVAFFTGKRIKACP